MKVLVAPMAAMAETSGPFSRAAALCRKLVECGHEAALCAALDVNYHEIDNIHNYYCPVPSPMGLPMFIGKRMQNIAQSLGIMQKKKVESFEQVLFFAGATKKSFFFRDVKYIRQAIREFKPDVVYSEFRPAAIVAAKLENVKSASGYSYPVQKSYACSPKFSKAVIDSFICYNLPYIESILDLFEWADIRIVPSSYELEPMDGRNITYTGPFAAPSKAVAETRKNRIIAYMGNGTISPKVLIGELTAAFKNTEYEVFIASDQVKPYKDKNIVVDKRFDFSELMPGAAAYINHGGQNSIMTGLIYGVPQIVCPGLVFERKYNGASVESLGAGKLLEASEFRSENIKNIIDDFKNDSYYRNNSIRAGESLVKLGGVASAVKALEELYRSSVPV